MIAAGLGVLVGSIATGYVVQKGSETHSAVKGMLADLHQFEKTMAQMPIHIDAKTLMGNDQHSMIEASGYVNQDRSIVDGLVTVNEMKGGTVRPSMRTQMTCGPVTRSGSECFSKQTDYLESGEVLSQDKWTNANRTAFPVLDQTTDTLAAKLSSDLPWNTTVTQDAPHTFTVHVDGEHTTFVFTKERIDVKNWADDNTVVITFTVQATNSAHPYIQPAPSEVATADETAAYLAERSDASRNSLMSQAIG